MRTIIIISMIGGIDCDNNNNNTKQMAREVNDWISERHWAERGKTRQAWCAILSGAEILVEILVEILDFNRHRNA